ncbi:PIN domain-containing protein [Aquimarina algiphila]|uniref:PIN domain-containing protein n=1 Tax=Aquimarina algiphila TaxID=2047982 RepID=UPI00232C0E07|nr:PIN domain-containing protein [Aquimarina algiphila]
MRILIDTNIIIHREASKVYNKDIGLLFNWLDKLKYEKCVHPLSIQEISNYKNSEVVDTMKIKIENYNLLKTVSDDKDLILQLRKTDKNINDQIDTSIIKEIYNNRVGYLITEDRGIHHKARILGVSERVFKIDDFLEKCIVENPELKDYNVLSVRKEYFGKISLSDDFFDSFKEDYKEFERWFTDKSDKESYVCVTDGIVKAFLYLKVEKKDESYSNITPQFKKKKRLKIGTLKVTSTGYKLGERFLKIVFDNAIQYKVEEIYVTIFDKREEQKRLIYLLQDWGFNEWGIKETDNGNEKVFVRTFGKELPVSLENPKKTFPFISRDTRKYIIKIEHTYHTELFPDSINTRENQENYIENEPHRNRIGKVYISHNKDRHLQKGDLVLIYRMGETSPKRFTSTITSICIVDEVFDNIHSFEEFFQICNRRTFIKEEDLRLKWWNKSQKIRPFVINLLFAHSFPTPKPTLQNLIDFNIIKDIHNIPRGFIEINNDQFNTLIKFAYRSK